MLIPLLLTGKTALHWAASVNSLEVTKELLRNGAKKDAQDEKVTQRLNMCFIEQNVAFKFFKNKFEYNLGNDLLRESTSMTNSRGNS